MGRSGNFANFVHSDRAMGAFIHPNIFNPYKPRIMVTLRIGKHTIEMYDTIDELPIVRFHKYQKLLLIDAGVGADIQAFDHRIERVRLFLADGKYEQAAKELGNLRQSVFLIQSELTPRHRAFAALITKLDGKVCDDISDTALEKITAALGDIKESELTARLEAVKKKNRC